MVHASRILLALTCLAAGCASTGPQGLNVYEGQGPVNSVLVLPARFESYPVGGRELWKVNDIISRQLAGHGGLAVLDSRELTLSDGVELPVLPNQLNSKSNLTALLARANSRPKEAMVVEPVITRRTRRVIKKRGGKDQAGFEVTLIIHLNLSQLHAPAVGLGTVSKEVKTPAFYLPAENEDPAANLFAGVGAAAAELRSKLGVFKGMPQGRVKWLKENLSLMARMDSAQIRSVLSVPNEIERLTQISFLAEMAYGRLRGREVEARMALPPGLRVAKDYGQRLKVGDIVTEVEGQAAVSPYQLARVLRQARSHLQVLRDGKLIEITLQQE